MRPDLLVRAALSRQPADRTYPTSYASQQKEEEEQVELGAKGARRERGLGWRQLVKVVGRAPVQDGRGEEVRRGSA